MGRPHVSSTLEVTAERDVRIEEGDIVLGRGGEKLVADVRDVYFPRRHAVGVSIGGDFCWWPLLAVGSEYLEVVVFPLFFLACPNSSASTTRQAQVLEYAESPVGIEADKA